MCDTSVYVSEGRVLFSKNSDRHPNEVQILDWQPAKKNTDKILRCTWIDIEQVPETCAVLLSRPAWMWGAEIGANEHGVVIGNEAVFTRDAVPKVGLTGMDLLRLALERSNSAKNAVEVMIKLLEIYPQGGRCSQFQENFRYFSSYIIADKREAYVFETSGKKHAVEKVERGVRTISNGLTIKGFAEKNSDAFKTLFSASALRRKTCTTLFERDNSIAGMFRQLGNHRNNASLPKSTWLRGTLDSVCMHGGGKFSPTKTTAAWVTEFADDTSQTWVTATSMPCLSLFKPVSTCEATQALVRVGESYWRDHERLAALLSSASESQRSEYQRERDQIQNDWLKAPPTSSQAFEKAFAFAETWTKKLTTETRQ